MVREQFDADGFASVPCVLSTDECNDIEALTGTLDPDAAGTRCLLAEEWCRTLAGRLRRHPGLADVVPGNFVAVQCTYFEKSIERNWLVPIHQDLSIPVAARVEHPALRGWSEKEGGIFVQPPATLLEQLVALRVHLDPCSNDDGPLQFIPGSHRHGRLSAEEAVTRRQAGPLVSCEMGQGDVLAMRPLVLHASPKAQGSSRRRILHFVFGPPELPYGISWQHAA
ncbi:phytanoyl-CoA dioxygenase family protein [Massilia sp. IC2-477]|uniref:phytanoyl-CoA dioxygenase family protein n=1 Tax=Massilia sp. IC2-477 TaxID=2887198 RepID=UPI001D1242C6|nr:phytanoyl-CoA dioxygenase family protein [Massilia sp. IC2-477]MCC2958418.1 phytanoyl-CoA dioxygenase family protein [Massilia sp. IC2-477]